ncbi:MAG: substrate-binding domain-containing protein [Lachnospiraceae bacterium]|nr:substrate-binding domain-containing protein [Lachnospiraceae bacterium]MDD7148816.1 substrate-binding domain-containing protein [Lachnospiraceae bacterium]MDY4068277.1 substrate-binding domain-containing protein [Lachnospiraceae bacterium]
MRDKQVMGSTPDREERQNGGTDREDRQEQQNSVTGQEKAAKSNRALVIAGICSVSFMLLITIGSMFFFRMQMDKASRLMEGASYESYESYYAMISSNHESALWRSIYQGAVEAAAENGAYVEMLGSNLSTDYSRQDLMRIAIASGVDGIILEADESGDYTGLINEADAAGIPVVTVMGDDTTSNRKSFIGVNNYNLGREYGRQVLLAGEDVQEVLVLISTSMPDTSQNIIFSGIQETLVEAGRDDIRVYAAAIEGDNTFAVEESVRDVFLEQSMDVLICLDELSTTCAYQAVVDFNRVGQIDIIGYYDSETILRGIERNVIHSTIALDTGEMGEYSIEALEEYRETGYVSDYFGVDTDLITIENVRDYLEDGGEQE